MRSTLVGAALFLFLFLQGCSISDIRDGIGSSPIKPSNKICTAEGILPQPHLRPNNCGVGVIIEPGKFKTQGDLSLLDLTNVKIDLSKSTVVINSSGGWGSLVITLADSSIVATSFQWENDGDSIIFSDLIALESLVLQYADQVQKVTIEVDNIEVESTDSVNTFVAEVKVASVVVSGLSESWYIEDGSCGGIFPEPQLCG
ncbi:MAG: hypothetical protein ACNA7J_07455 [Wenzhouxiangella sp.]